MIFEASSREASQTSDIADDDDDDDDDDVCWSCVDTIPLSRLIDA